ncbi:M13 family metallopeptidase [Luteibacter sp. SG786]|uniref:M13-type metalloendopeptidase n=1 Tax=Luteibacter sp. SG786 TaxID=2587130 RepID=UPI001423CB42|nr:M13 family metallopeptidase [Luteibacter sp. SG786]NII55129.1 putative endopeptidase [Luteibacter sp. SG786]
MKSTVVLFAGLLGMAAAASPVPEVPVAPSAAPSKTAQPQAAPGDDFDRYVNGAWERDHPVPADRTSIGMWPDMQAKAVEQSRLLVEEAAAVREPMGILYASYMDQPMRDRQGLRPLQAWLAGIDAIGDRAAFAAAIGQLARIDVGAIVVPIIEEDDGHPGQSILTLREGRPGLPNVEAYHATEGPAGARREAYRTYLVAMLTATGVPPSEAAGRVDAVLGLEARLAESQLGPAAQRDAVGSYHPVPVGELSSRVPGFAWSSWFAALGIEHPDRVNVAHPAVLRAQLEVVAAAPLDVLRDLLRLKLMNTYSRYVDARNATARLAYYGGALRGTTAEPPAWKRGVDLVTNLMPETLSRAYVEHYFPPAAKARAQAIADDVRIALAARVNKATWLSPSARAEVSRKLKRTRISIGYPDTWPAAPTVALREDDLAGNVARLTAWRFDQAVARLTQPLDRTTWQSPVSVPNAYASAAANEVIFPAALLQPPLFDPTADPAANYARLGATIGHELSHLFDDQGLHYDADGRLRDTWSTTDAQRFEAKANALAKQLEGYEPLPGHHVNGRLVLGESLADLTGLLAAHDAFAAKAAPAGEGRREADRRFFTAWAQLWRTSYREAYLRTLLPSDAHPPGAVRLSTVRNVDAWYDAFDVRRGALYLAPSERIRIW